MKDLKLSFKYSNETAVSTIISQAHLSVVLTPSGTESANHFASVDNFQLYTALLNHFQHGDFPAVVDSVCIHFACDSNDCHRFIGRLGRESSTDSIQLEYPCTPSTCIATDVVRQTMASAFFLR